MFKKAVKQLSKNYLKHYEKALLPITGKIFERFLYSQMFEFFIGNIFIGISQNQSGIKPRDSCIN